MSFNVQEAAVFAHGWDNEQAPKIEEWFAFAWAREIPPPLGMPEGVHLNLGAGYRDIGDALPLDREHFWDADSDPIPHETESVAGIHANGFFEHVRDVPAVLRECERVLVSGGVLNIVVPHGLSDLYVEDVTHTHPISEETWKNLFDNPYYNVDGRWLLKVHTCFILGIAWRNLGLFTQMVKTPDPF